MQSAVKGVDSGAFGIFRTAFILLEWLLIWLRSLFLFDYRTLRQETGVMGVSTTKGLCVDNAAAFPLLLLDAHCLVTISQKFALQSFPSQTHLDALSCSTNFLSRQAETKRAGMKWKELEIWKSIPSRAAPSLRYGLPLQSFPFPTHKPAGSSL